MVRRDCLHRPDYGFTARRGQMEAEVSSASFALTYTQTHTYTFGNQFFTGQLPCNLCQPSLMHMHMHTHAHTCARANYGHSPEMVIVAVHT